VSPAEQNFDGGKLQTATYKSWDQLSEVLAGAGISPETLRSTKAALDSEGLYTLRDIALSPEQLLSLGFKE
jgi:hypothetical protein